MENAIKWVHSLQVGSEVYIRCLRSEHGCCILSRDHLDYGAQPLVKCRIDRIGVCGIKDILALVWADTGSPVGLPFQVWDLRDQFGAELAFPLRTGR